MTEHGPLRVATFVDPMFQENGYLVSCEGAPDAWIIDPGLPPQPRQIAAALAEYELEPVAILLTHGHADHIAGCGPLRQLFPKIELIAPRAEEHLLTDAEANLSAALGFAIVAPPADWLLDPGDTLALGDLSWEARDVSGHSPGGLAYYCAEARVVFGGDALFAGGIGRYDFPGSSGRRLLANIRASLLTLPGATVLYSGHGPATTIDEEIATNTCLGPGFAPEN